MTSGPVSAPAVRTLIDVVRLSTSYLGDHGSDSPRLDAELLAAHGLTLRRLDLYLQFDRPLDDAELTAIRELVRRRAGGEPVAYITGEREFYSRPFAVTPAVLIPRPETETLVEETLRWVQTRASGPLRILDFGTGSGCIAVTLAAELPDAVVIAVDTSSDAIAVAKGNADRNGVADRVDFVEGDWWAALGSDAVFDLVVSNPPYVSGDEMAGLARDVADHEPHVALDGGPDGLDSYRTIAAQLAARLRPAGMVAVEVDPRRAESVAQLLRESLGDGDFSLVNDLTARPRVVLAQRTG